MVYGLLGRIVSFSGLTRNERLRKALEPALETYIKGLEESDPAVREEVVGRLEAIPIGQKDIVAASRSSSSGPTCPPTFGRPQLQHWRHKPPLPALPPETGRGDPQDRASECCG